MRDDKMSDENEACREFVSPRLAAMFWQCGQELKDQGVADADDAMLAILRDLNELAEQSLDKNSAFSKELRKLTTAEEAEVAGEWSAAREIYEQLLQEAISAGELSQQARFHLRLSTLAIREGDYRAAFASAQAAVELARSYGVQSLVEMACGALSSAARRLGRLPDAIAAADEGLTANEASPLNEVTRACLLIQRAHAQLLDGQVERAQTDLDQSWPMLQADGVFQDAPGILWRLGQWWRVEAKARAVSGDWNREREAWESALDHQRKAISVWRIERWESEAVIRLCEKEISEIAGEFVAAAERAGHTQTAQTIRMRIDERTLTSGGDH